MARIGFAVLALIVGLFAGPALAWDAGPSQCKHDVCSGGVDPNSFADTQPAYADSVIPGRLADCPSGYTNNGIAGCGRGADSKSSPSVAASCPDGYTNNGLTCGRGAHSYGNYCKGGCAPGYTNTGCTCFRGVSTLTASSMVCPAGYWKDEIVFRCHKNCDPGYTQMGESCFRGVSTLGPSSFICGANEHRGGGLNANKCFPNPGPCSADREEYGVSGASLCFKKCPAGSRRTAISTCTHDVKWRGNTHLYVVRNALQLLSTSSDPIAQKAYKTMSADPCKTQWEDGLWDADDPDGPLVDRPDSSSKGGGTHFYNASHTAYVYNADGTFKPQTTAVVTYLLAGVEANFKGNAREQAKKWLPDPVTLNNNPGNDQCHGLGLALHYETDMTQPMHATSFSALDLPTMLHAALEEYVPTIQARFPAQGPWDQRWKGMTADNVFYQTSFKSGKTNAPILLAPLAYKGTICSMNPETGALYTGMCFANQAPVDTAIGTVLREGYQSTASYIYAAFNTAAK